MPAIPMNLPWVESPFFESLLREKSLSAEDAVLARQYHEQGYVKIEGLVTEDEARAAIEGARPLYTSAADGPRSRYRVMDGWRESPAIAALAAKPRVLRTLEMLYARRPFPFQTLSFAFGSQQSGHSDQIHFSSLPARFMCGVWIALEDVTEENGPLFYYPGSHKLPEYDLGDLMPSAARADYPAYERFLGALMVELGLQPHRLLAKRGDGLIWSSNIVHGGTPIGKEGATRHSQVTHYYFEDCLYYTPLISNRTMGEYALRHDIVDIRTGKSVSMSYNGRPFRGRSLVNGRTFIDLDGASMPYLYYTRAAVLDCLGKAVVRVNSRVSRNATAHRALKRMLKPSLKSILR